MRRCTPHALLIGLMLLHVGADAPKAVSIDHARPMFFTDRAGDVRPVRSAADWAARRAAILAGMQEVMGSLPDDRRKVAADVRVLETVALDGYVRKKITFGVEAGDRVAAYLLLPAGAKGKLPAVLCLHQTTPNGKASPAGLTDRATIPLAEASPATAIAG